MDKIFEFVLKNWKLIAAAIALIISGAAIGAIIVSHHDRKVYNALQKEHDIDTAKKLSLAFENKLLKILEKYKKLKDKADQQEKTIEQIKNLCQEYQIPYACVLKAKYAA